MSAFSRERLHLLDIAQFLSQFVERLHLYLLLRRFDENWVFGCYEAAPLRWLHLGGQVHGFLQTIFHKWLRTLRYEHVGFRETRRLIHACIIDCVHLGTCRLLFNS